MADIDKLDDTRIGCLSIMTTMKVREFMEVIEPAYENRGGLKGQRPALKTKTALTIRKRLVDDLKNGAIVPPVVVGVQCLDVNKLDELRAVESQKDLLKNLSELPRDSISIIDGMQRTTAFIEANDELDGFADRTFQRIEFWISDTIGSLVYRMLVLNTGQVPWEIARQLETIYSQFLQRLKEELGSGIEVFLRDDERRRRDAAQYQASAIIRLFLSFASRRMEFDLKDKIAEDFARIDTVEASSHQSFFDLFVRSMKLLVRLDCAFSNGPSNNASAQVRIGDGRAIFQSYPALVGFVTAIAIKTMDEPSFPVDWDAAPAKMDDIERKLSSLIDRLGSMSPENLDSFLSLDILNQRLSIRTGQVGRFEREVFYKAFDSMIRNAERLENMQPCWLA